MDTKRRIENLEKATGADKPECKTWVVVKGEPEPEGVAETDTVIWVTSGKAKELTLQIIAGEGT